MFPAISNAGQDNILSYTFIFRKGAIVMTPKETMFHAFERKHLDHVPATVFGGGVWTIRHHQTQFGEAIADPKAYAELLIRTNEELNSPIVYVGSGYNNYLAAAVGGTIKERKLGAPDLTEEIIKEHADELDNIDPAIIEDDPIINNIWEATRLVAKAIGEGCVAGLGAANYAKKIN